MSKVISVLVLTAMMVLTGCACHKPAPAPVMEEYGGK